MKSQLSVDFVISLIVFILFSTYIFFRILALRPAYLSELENERIRSEAFQISEILVKDAGEPANWQKYSISGIKRIGLLNESYNQSNLLSVLKISQLNNLCNSNYDEVKKRIGAQDIQFSLRLVDIPNNKILLNCIPPRIKVRTLGINFTIVRIVALDSGSYGNLSVTVW